ncbi:SRPBCC domain-containing protein [Paenibacillus sp. J5C_2022]|uniref:SRPBCC domain-containing protein n=1 Tax=Paenibacillus sp. J5C2022 TaxID=2977129 RepID=UPI0021CF45DA|nr:SRPBCC domain-containing protein [Paenibacillus sp. J5C2022]MCU6708256.1 SRPBCC domain-containing protein [Paenibacillus sp. J5C2022]
MSNEMTFKAEGNEIVAERVFNAPRELVFQVYTEAEHLKNWWGPQGWTVPVCHVDFRVGGVWHYCMKCEDKNQGDFFGMESWGKGIYREIDHGNSFVYNDYFSDAEGNENAEMPAALITVQFLEEEGKTRVVSKTRYDSAEQIKTLMEMGMKEGFTQTWDRLSEYLVSVK